MNMTTDNVEFYVRYQKYSISNDIYEKIEGTALEAVLSGRQCDKMMYGLPQIDRPQRNFIILMDYLEKGVIPKDRQERNLLRDEMKLWCFEDADLVAL